VTKENFKAILRQAYGSDNSTMAASIFKMFDTDGSGYVPPTPCVSVAGTQTITDNTQHATRNTQHATRNTQHATRNTQIDRFPRVCDGVELHALGSRGGRGRALLPLSRSERRRRDFKGFVAGRPPRLPLLLSAGTTTLTSPGGM
jgi:hypothetical protein